MDVLGDLMGGFATALSLQNLLIAAIGVTLGTLVGVLPGIGPALTVALLLPLTYNFDPTGAFILFAGIYYGGMYGGSTTSILLNTPGESASVATTIEGFAMARAGRGGAALATAAIGSFVAGTLSTVAMIFLLFVAGISLIGVTHQAAWLATSDEPAVATAAVPHSGDTRMALRWLGHGFGYWSDVYGVLPPGGSFTPDGGGPCHAVVTASTDASGS